MPPANPVASVRDVLLRLNEIDAALPGGDGAAVFNRMYLSVTEAVAAALAGAPVVRDPAFMEHLDVTFASLWLDAYDARGDALPRAWAPLFERRDDHAVLPVQFAVAGMNAHIAHDLPVAVVRACHDFGASPEDAKVSEDYEAVNRLLAAAESTVRRSFLSEAGQAADDRVGPVVHLISSWNIDMAREAAWVSAEALWALRDAAPLARRYENALARSVGMASRLLLTPVEGSAGHP
jgi:hypothetical protein